jgi:hypothetical protein
VRAEISRRLRQTWARRRSAALTKDELLALGIGEERLEPLQPSFISPKASRNVGRSHSWLVDGGVSTAASLWSEGMRTGPSRFEREVVSMGDCPMTLISRSGVWVLVHCGVDGSLRVAAWEHRLAVEGLDLVDYTLPAPSSELLERRFDTVEELTSAVDREVLGQMADVAPERSDVGPSSP